MEWFKGTISAAVETAKLSSSHLLVFVDGNDDGSKRRVNLLESCVELKKKTYTGLYIKTGSTGYNQVKDIYGHLDSSTLLVIDSSNGFAVERFPSSTEDTELLQRLLSLLPDTPTLEKEHGPSLSVVTFREATPGAEADSPIVAKKEGVSNYKQDQLPSHSGTANETRIQLKLQGGLSEIVICKAESTLADVRIRASNIFQLGQAFDLALPYPRRTFSSEEESQTVENLGLCPASTLLVLPHESNLQPRFLYRGILQVLAPLFQFFENFWRRFFPRPADPKKKNN